MKTYLKLTAVVTAFLLLTGCTDGSTYPDGTQTPPTGQNQPTEKPQQPVQYPQTNAVPPQEAGVGYEKDLASFMYAYPPLSATGNVKKGAFKEYYITVQNSDGYFDRTQSKIQRVEEGMQDDLGDQLITVFEDNIRKESAIINETRISVAFYDNGVDTGTEQYQRYFRLHEDMLRNENGACVYKEIWDNLDMSEIVPIQANPNTESAQYSQVLQVYCGTVNGTKIDRFYANGWGIVAEIIQLPTGETKYSILNQSTYEIY